MSISNRFFGRRNRKQERDAKGFGKHVPWTPDDLPDNAFASWPPKRSWPSVAEVDRILKTTERKPDARLAVLSGLRRWSEPASSQMLAALGSIIISIVAIAIAIAIASNTAVPGLQWSVLVVGAAYIILALWGFGLALRMDERRRMALVWLRAIEDAIQDAKTTKSKSIWGRLRP